jgi:hypothetical protein
MSTKGPPPSITGDLAAEDEERLAKEIGNFVFLLLKGIKNIGIYKHAESRYAEYLEPAYSALTAFLAANEVLPLKLTPYTLEFKKHVVYEDQDKENLTYKFYKDGLRYILFRTGIPPEEMLKFVLLAMGKVSEAQLFQEDMVTRLWKENFMFIEHIVVEGFGFGDMSEEDVEIEVEKIIGYLRKQLAANSEDITRFARLSAEDLELELEDVDQVRGGIVSGRTATLQDKSTVQEELFHEEKKRLFAKMVLILFQTLELECDAADYDMMLEAFTQVLDTLLVSEDVRGSVALRHRFDNIATKALPADRLAMVRRLGEAFKKRMAEQQRLDSVGQYLMLNKDLNEEAVKAYFSVCTEEELIPLVDMLSGMERQEGRRILIDVLADIGKKHCEVFARRLDHNSSNVVKDMLAIILKIAPDNKIQLIAKTLEHPNVMIRLEGLKTLAKSNDDVALRYIEKAAADNDLQMRLGAYRALAVRSPNRAGPALVKLMQADDYLGKDSRERIAIATALGETRTQLALDYFNTIFEKKGGLFTAGKSNDLKMMAVVGLQAHHSVAAFKVLAREVQNRGNSKEVLQAVHKAATRLKTELQGGQEGQQDG